MVNKYTPQTANPKPWDDIEKHYIDLNEQGWEHDHLLALVRHIVSSGLSNRLFGYTSMDKLVVSIYEPVEWNREALHIEFNRHTQRWRFEYYSKPFEKVPFERFYDKDKGIEKLDAFVKLIGW